MIEVFVQYPVPCMVAAIGFMVLLYFSFFFQQYIPHLLISVYFILPLFYSIFNIPNLPLTTVFVIFLGPIVLMRTSFTIVKSIWPVLLYSCLIILLCLLHNISLWEIRSAFIPIVISSLCVFSFSQIEMVNNTSLNKPLLFFTYIIIGWILLNSIFSILQFIGGEQFYIISVTETSVVDNIKRGYGLIGMATQVGFVFCLGLPLILTFLLNTKRKKLFLLFSITGMIGLVLSFSRAAVLGICTSIFSMLILSKKTKLALVFLLSFILAIAFYKGAVILLPPEYTTFFLGKDSSASSRSAFVGIGIKMFMDKPLIGWGYGGFYENVIQYGSSMKIEAHNTFIQVLVEYGVFGFLSFLSVIVFSIKGYINYIQKGKSNEFRNIAIGFLGSLIAMLIDAYFHCCEWNLTLWLPICMGYFFNSANVKEKLNYFTS